MLRRQHGDAESTGVLISHVADGSAWLQADQYLLERGRRHVVGHEGLADVVHQHESELAALALLVAMHRLDQRFDVHRGRQRRGEADLGDHVLDAVSEADRREPSLLGQSCRGHQPEPDRLAVGE